MKKKFKIENLDCANCAAKMENEINKLGEVNKASISFMTSRLTLEADDDKFDTILSKVENAMKKIEDDVKLCY